MKSRAQRYRYVRHVVSGTRPSPWSPLSLGSSLAAWYKADAGCYTDAACLFASASSQYLSKTSPTFEPTTKMTIAASWKPTSVGDDMAIAGRYVGLDEGWMFIQRSDGKVSFQMFSAGIGYEAVTSVALSAGVQYRLVLVYDGTQASGSRAKIYIDGVDRTASDNVIAAIVATTAVTLGIGAFPGIGYVANGAIARLGFSSLALSGAALTAAHTSTFWADMTAARQADWFSFYNLCEASSTRVDSTGLNNLTPTNGPTVAAGPGEGLAVNNSPVKRWESRYGGVHAVQATITKQPLWMAAGGASGTTSRVLFDGTDDYMESASGVTLSNASMLALLSGGASGSKYALDFEQVISMIHSFFVPSSVEFYDNIGTHFVVGDDSAAGFHASVFGGDASGVTSKFDGADGGSTGVAMRTVTNRVLTVGAAMGGVVPWNASISEIVSASAYSTADLALLGTYLNARR